MTGLRTIINAVATQLDGMQVGYWPGLTGTYPKTPPRPPVFAKRLQTAPEALAISVYGLELDPDPNDPTEVFQVQVRTRSPQDADPLADKVIAALHGKHNQVWAGILMQRCRHLSTAQLGIDQTANLDERTDNFELEILP